VNRLVIFVSLDQLDDLRLAQTTPPLGWATSTATGVLYRKPPC
jgi:hypothetical protein